MAAAMVGVQEQYALFSLARNVRLARACSGCGLCLYSPRIREGSFSEAHIHTPAYLYGSGAYESELCSPSFRVEVFPETRGLSMCIRSAAWGNPSPCLPGGSVGVTPLFLGRTTVLPK